MRYYQFAGIGTSNSKLVNIVASQLGNVGGAPYWSWYGFNSRVEWCACFVSWCADQAGLIENGKVPKFAYCPSGIQWFKAHNQWLDKGIIPQGGYIIFFDWENDGVSDHVGIVEKVDSDYIYTIEGNSDFDGCRRKLYNLYDSVIIGYGLI